MKCAFRKASERSVIRAPPPHSPGNPRMNPQEGARLKNSWTAGRPQDHGEGLFCIEDGGGNVTWSPQRLSGYLEDAFLTKNTVVTSFVNCIHGEIEYNPGDGRCGAGKFVAAPESSNKSSGKEPGCEGSSLSKDAHTSLSSSSSWGTPGPAERRSLPSVINTH
ncbi:uncharacterized protein LOC144990919 isoform X2 [Oryzias latipes]